MSDSVLKSGMSPNLDPVGRDYFVGLDTRREHSQSVCILGYTLLFVVPSVTLVNIKKG